MAFDELVVAVVVKNSETVAVGGGRDEVLDGRTAVMPCADPRHLELSVSGEPPHRLAEVHVGHALRELFCHTAGLVPHRSRHSEVRVGPQGRIVIPAALRRLLGIEPGQTMVARVQGQQLILEPRTAALARLRARVGGLDTDADLVDELIEERRREARRETER